MIQKKKLCKTHCLYKVSKAFLTSIYDYFFDI